MTLVAERLTGFSAIRLLNGAVRPSPDAVARDVPYGALPRQRLDVYRPAKGRAPFPVVVFFYGGSWQSGEKSDYAFVADALASRGFLTIVPDYRVYPEVKFPAFVEDAACAVRWVRDHAAEFAVDADRICVMGHSAGAHIAALLSLDPRYLRGVGLDRSAIGAMVGLAGPYDFLPLRSEALRALFGPPDGWPSTQPINFVDGREPPMLLLTGSWDAKVGPGNTRRLVARVCQSGGRARAIFYRGLGHGTLLAAFSRPLRSLAPVLEDTAAFLREH